MLLRIRKDITKDDNLVIYYAGHGIYDEKQQQGAWVPVDADPEKSSDNFINEQLLQFLSKIDVRHTFVIADACFSGSLFVEDSQVSFQPNNDKLKSRWGLSSGNLEEVADGVAGTRSPFVTELLAALEEYKRDAFPISELINVVKFRVKNLNRQTPIGKPLAVDGNEGGEYILYKK
jgi:hypothetical protein